MNSSKFSTCSSNLYGKWVEGEEGEMRGWIQTFDMVLYQHFPRETDSLGSVRY